MANSLPDALKAAPGPSLAQAPPGFELVYRENFEFIWRILRGMGVLESAIEDVAQEVFLVVLRRLPEFDGRGSVRSWLFPIALRIASNYRRGLRRKGAEALPETLVAPGPSPAEVAGQRQALQEVPCVSCSSSVNSRK
jgi:RNA polymerase sigma-70 factor (ECF subfamily)